MLEEGDFLSWYLVENQARLKKHYGILTSFLEQHDIPYFKGGNAGIFLWVDVRKYITETIDSIDKLGAKEREARLARAWPRKGVMIANGSNFRSEEPGWVRITFTAEEQALREGLRRFMATLEWSLNDLEMSISDEWHWRC